MRQQKAMQTYRLLKDRRAKDAVTAWGDSRMLQNSLDNGV